MYDWLSVATTGLSDVASPLRPMTKSLPAARPDWGVRPMTAASNAIRMAWITEILRSCVRLSSVRTTFYHGDGLRDVSDPALRGQSPNRLKPSTLTKMARPGNVAIHQAE